MKRIISMVMISLITLSSFASAGSDSIKLEVNKQEVIFDVEPLIVENRSLVPIRPVFEALGLEVSWDEKSRTVSGSNGDNLIKLQIDKEMASVNGKDIKLELPSVIIKGRAMAPVRFIGQAVGADVNWDPVTKTVSINKSDLDEDVVKKSLTYSNLVDEKSQDEVRKAMETAGILTENIDFFFEELNYYNNTIENKSLVEDGFTTIDSLIPEYDLIAIQDAWNSKNLEFIGYNCRIISYDLMKDSIKIGKTDITNSDWMVFDKNSLDNNPKEVFNKEERKEFETLYSSIPAEHTKDISVHLENVKKDWKSKGIEFSNSDKRSIVSVFFHDYEDYLFIGHMGVLIPSEDGELLFIEKLSFLEPYQAVKFKNRTELNDYLMNKYDISWGQETADPFIMENGELLEGYRKNPNKNISD